MKSIFDKTVESGQFNILVYALQEAGLTDILRSDGPFTVFVPTDEAFNKLSKKTLEHILRDKERLTEILTYHVLPVKIKSIDIKKIAHSITVQGSELIFNGSNEIMVNNAKIVKKDIECINGIIHVIDKVLIPR